MHRLKLLDIIKFNQKRQGEHNMKLNIFWSDNYNCWTIAEDGIKYNGDPIGSSLTREASDKQILDLVSETFHIEENDELKILR